MLAYYSQLARPQDTTPVSSRTFNHPGGEPALVRRAETLDTLVHVVYCPSTNFMKAHPYTVAEGHERLIWLVLVLISVVLAAVLVFLIPLLLSRVTALPQIDTGDFGNALAALMPLIHGSPLLLCLFIVYAVFDKWAWRWPLIREVPNLNGTWAGELVSQARPDEPLAIELKVRQRWSKIMITIESDRTFSYSVNASVSYKGMDRVEVINTYVAEPKANGDPPVISRHHGTNIFSFLVASQRLTEITGVYYTERNQGNNGSIRFAVE
jgi:hypothetical protein